MQNCRNVKTKNTAGRPARSGDRSKAIPEIEAGILSEIKNANDPVIVIDSTSRIVQWNHAAEVMFGYSADEVVGQAFNIIIPEEYHSLNKYRMRLMSQTGVADFPETPVELVVKKKDGSEVVGAFQPTMLKTKTGMFFSIAVRDITDQRQHRTLPDLPAACRRQAGSNDFDDIVRTAGMVLNASFAVYRKTTGDLLYCEANWNAPKGFSTPHKKNGAVCYDIIKKNSQTPVLIRKFNTTSFAETEPAIEQDIPKTVLGIPVRNGKNAIGALCLFYNEDRKADENELRILAVFAHALEDRETCVNAGKRFDQYQRKLEIAETNIRRLSRQILLYREEERKNISVALHDEVGSMVVSLSSGLTIAEEEIKDGNLDDALMQIIQVKKKLDNAVENIKEIAVDLRPPDLNIIGLKGVLEEFFLNVEEQTKIKIHFNYALGDTRLNDTIATALYRFVQESLNNCIKHAGAHMIVVVLGLDGNMVKIEICDDGRGFDSERKGSGSISKKIGLWGMKMRAQALGGTFNINSQIDKGTTIVIEIPLQEEGS